MFRRTGIVSALALTSYLLCGFSQPDTCASANKGPSIAGPAIGIGAALAVAIIVPVVIVHNHHTLKGCVMTDANGMQIQEDGDSAKSFTLIGDTPGVKVGDLVKLHGVKKKGKNGTKVERTFIVEKITKDYGACKLPDPAAPKT